MKRVTTHNTLSRLVAGGRLEREVGKLNRQGNRTGAE